MVLDQRPRTIPYNPRNYHLFGLSSDHSGTRRENGILCEHGTVLIKFSLPLYLFFNLFSVSVLIYYSWLTIPFMEMEVIQIIYCVAV